MENTENLVGKLLSDRYNVLDKIGTGGMAMVYKAHDKVLDRDVAIKILRDVLEDNDEIVSNFIKEARSSASLVHPNVVSVYDVCEYEGLNYMVMELVDGITLKKYIMKNPRLPWQEACDYAIQIGQGIQAAHDRGIIHRDIKPQNIIMAPGGVLKVTDFGIAKAMESDTSIVGGTATGSVHYISPEQARGGFTDFRSDIYSLGIVLYEMLAGRVPFDGDSPVSVALMHIEEEPINVKCVNMDISSDLAYVTMKAMNREQGKRYQNMQEFLDDLRAVLADENLPSREGEEVEVDVEPIPEPEIRNRRKVNVDTTSNSTKRNKKKPAKSKDADRNSVILALSTVAVIILVVAGILLMTVNPFAKSIPDLAGMTLDEAQKVAKRSGYTVSSEIEYCLSDSVAADLVVYQSPAAGTQAKKTEPIKLILSLGASGGGIPVPDVINTPIDDAGALIESYALLYKVVSEYSDDVEYGNIIRQSPLAGTHINAGDIVTLHMSIGPETEVVEKKKVTVPNLRGMTRDIAETSLAANGLITGTVTNMPSDSPEGTVIRQSPAAGTKVDEQSTVTLVISSGNTSSTLSSEYENVEIPPIVEQQAEQEVQQSQTQQPEKENAVVPVAEEPEPTQQVVQQTQAPVVSAPTVESNSSSGEGTKMFTVKIPDAANDSVRVEIVVDGNIIHDAMHSKSEGAVAIEIPINGTASVQAYIDGAKVSDKTITQ